MIVATADSNIYISALQFGGIARQFLNAARDGTFRLAISDAIIAEVRGILLTKFDWTQGILDEAISELRDFTQSVSPTQRVRVIAEDPDDDRIIECALASNSQFLVSGDKDLLRHAQYKSVRIIKLAEFLKLIPEPI